MFGKRKTPGQDDKPGTGETVTGGEGGAESEGTGARPLQRRALDPIGQAPRRAEPRGEARGAPAAGVAEGRKLVVGREIRLSGEIKKCEKLVVEGEVEANLNDCLSLEIADSGLFDGAAIVQEAEISGRFDGQLTVNGRLLLRSTGCIKGDIRYTDLEIQRGGKIAGTVDMIGEGGEAAAAPETASAPEGDADDSAEEADSEGAEGNGAARGNGEAASEQQAAAIDQGRLRLDR